MDREIKFRAYDKWAKKITYDLYDDPGDIQVSNVNGFFKQDQYVFMQYTGLKDGRGNEIYENDFVKFRPNYTNKPIHESVGLIAFNNNQWMLQANGTYYSISEETDEFYCYSEILGNIHQNPELL